MRRLSKLPAVAVVVVALLVSRAGPASGAAGGPRGPFAPDGPAAVTSDVVGSVAAPDLATMTSGDLADLVPGEILVRFRPEARAARAQAAAEIGATPVRTLMGTEVALWRVPVGRERALAARLSGRPDVVYAEPNYVYQVFTTPDDPALLSLQWAHSIMGSTQAWSITTGSANTVIAIIDTGVDNTHPDLAAKMVAGYDFVDNDAIPQDGYGHGTHVAGIAAAATNNGMGVAGMDWQARIMPVRVLGSDGKGSVTQVAVGIKWSVEHGADILNLSFGGPDYSQTLQDEINTAHAKGVLVVAAMGNYRTPDNPTNYPAAMNNVFAVAATTNADVYAPYSQYGPHCDIAAPGGYMTQLGDQRGIYSTLPTYPCTLTGFGYVPNYDQLQGTSMATPYVSGLAGLVWAAAPTLTPDQVQAVIESTAVDLGPTGWDPNYGWGRIDAAAAVQSVAPAVQVTNLHVTQAVADASTLTVTLGWTPPANAMTVTVRYATSAITPATWGSATPLTGPLPGSSNSVTAAIPYVSGTRYFALETQDAAGTWSALSNNAFWPVRSVYLPLIFRN